MEVNSGGVRIHVEETGEGRPVVFLHGFPDSGALWRNQVPALADAGFRCIVPDLRGYGSSDAPSEVAQYDLLFSVGDVVAVLDQLGVDRAHVVGHDWGAALAWTLASFLPDRVDHLAALSVGHPAAFRAAGIGQMSLSWFMFFFQFEGVAERWLSGDGWANFRSWCLHPDADEVIARWEATGSLTAALNWYRGRCAPHGVGGADARVPGGAGPHDGRVEHRRLRPHRRADARVVRTRGRSVALRAHRRTRSLAAARGTRRGEPPAARLPPRLKTRRAGPRAR